MTLNISQKHIFKSILLLEMLLQDIPISIFREYFQMKKNCFIFSKFEGFITCSAQAHIKPNGRHFISVRYWLDFIDSQAFMLPYANMKTQFLEQKKRNLLTVSRGEFGWRQFEFGEKKKNSIEFPSISHQNIYFIFWYHHFSFSP